NRVPNKTDENVFWAALYAAPVAWLVFGLGAMLQLSFQWTVCVAVAIVLNVANVMGYTRCYREAQRRAGGNSGSTTGAGVVQNAVASIVGAGLGRSLFG
ncbi:Golgi apparatus membrane protein TVP23 A, partial [Entophlyctis luteolus]